MFKYCPNCRSEKIDYDGFKLYLCRDCSWTYYQNACAAVMAILTYKGKILFTIRAKDPAKDKLDFPGGFVDPGETAEEAVERELKEELSLENLSFTYLGSAVNRYEYKNITYASCDLVFTARITSLPVDIQKSEIKDTVLLDLDEINDQDIAFSSMKKAIDFYLIKVLNLTY